MTCNDKINLLFSEYLIENIDNYFFRYPLFKDKKKGIIVLSKIITGGLTDVAKTNTTY